MADYSSVITVRNGYTSSPLTRISYSASQGNWATPPRAEIGPGESDTFKLNPSTGGVSEGEVTYRTTSGTQFKIYFKCASGGNACTVNPPSMASVSFNAAGSPLNATVQVLEA
ncbi:hypothetical protein PsYK624_160060 [Phanerochaete sordida]|uniref:Uncharacterized protein n=1 Tax=Phanerochaete sordida TaxID=48140 RepID=A0A9P3GU89_9APHY|nr:hypothetical protein PsYK624_160060 [Phanerochaete sordida]